MSSVLEMTGVTLDRQDMADLFLLGFPNALG